MTYSALVVLPHVFSPPDGPISAETCARLEAAAELHHTGVAPLIVTSGWAGLVSSVSIAEAMADYLRLKGVTALLPQTQSRDTVGDAVFTYRVAPGPIMVVTSAYHVRRAMEVFSFVFGAPVAVRGVQWPEEPETAQKEQRSLEAFRKTFEGIKAGDVDAIHARLRERHPFYNGDVFPRIPPHESGGSHERPA